MTAVELVALLVNSRKGVTPERVAKAKARAVQFGIPWCAVEALAPQVQHPTGCGATEPT